MASGSKESSVFTGNSIGGSPGDSDGLKRSSGGKGTTNLAAFPQDNVHGVSLPNTMGKELAGSTSNLSHSLSGASAVQRQTGKTKTGI